MSFIKKLRKRRNSKQSYCNKLGVIVLSNDLTHVVLIEYDHGRYQFPVGYDTSTDDILEQQTGINVLNLTILKDALTDETCSTTYEIAYNKYSALYNIGLKSPVETKAIWMTVDNAARLLDKEATHLLSEAIDLCITNNPTTPEH